MDDVVQVQESITLDVSGIGDDEVGFGQHVCRRYTIGPDDILSLLQNAESNVRT